MPTAEPSTKIVPMDGPKERKASTGVVHELHLVEKHVMDLLPKHVPDNHAAVQTMLERFDKDNDGTFSREEVEAMAHFMISEQKKVQSMKVVIFAMMALVIAGGVFIYAVVIAANETTKDTRPNSHGVLRTSAYSTAGEVPVQVDQLKSYATVTDLPQLSSDILRTIKSITLMDVDGAGHYHEIVGHTKWPGDGNAMDLYTPGSFKISIRAANVEIVSPGGTQKWRIDTSAAVARRRRLNRLVDKDGKHIFIKKTLAHHEVKEESRKRHAEAPANERGHRVLESGGMFYGKPGDFLESNNELTVVCESEPTEFEAHTADDYAAMNPDETPAIYNEKAFLMDFEFDMPGVTAEAMEYIFPVYADTLIEVMAKEEFGSLDPHETFGVAAPLDPATGRRLSAAEITGSSFIVPQKDFSGAPMFHAFDEFPALEFDSFADFFEPAELQAPSMLPEGKGPRNKTFAQMQHDTRGHQPGMSAPHVFRPAGTAASSRRLKDKHGTRMRRRRRLRTRKGRGLHARGRKLAAALARRQDRRRLVSKNHRTPGMPPVYTKDCSMCDVCIDRYVTDGCSTPPVVTGEDCDSKCGDCVGMMVDLGTCSKLGVGAAPYAGDGADAAYDPLLGAASGAGEGSVAYGEVPFTNVEHMQKFETAYKHLQAEVALAPQNNLLLTAFKENLAQAIGGRRLTGAGRRLTIPTSIADTLPPLDDLALDVGPVTEYFGGEETNIQMAIEHCPPADFMYVGEAARVAFAHEHGHHPDDVEITNAAGYQNNTGVVVEFTILSATPELAAKTEATVYEHVYDDATGPGLHGGEHHNSVFEEFWEESAHMKQEGNMPPGLDVVDMNMHYVDMVSHEHQGYESRSTDDGDDTADADTDPIDVAAAATDATREPFMPATVYDDFKTDPQAFGVGTDPGFTAQDYYSDGPVHAPPTFASCEIKCGTCIAQYITGGCGAMGDDDDDNDDDDCAAKCTDCVPLVVDTFTCSRFSDAPHVQYGYGYYYYYAYGVHAGVPTDQDDYMVSPTATHWEANEAVQETNW
jgi:hypothetical protein